MLIHFEHVVHAEHDWRKTEATKPWPYPVYACDRCRLTLSQFHAARGALRCIEGDDYGSACIGGFAGLAG